MSSTTLLPITARELRVAARKRSTFWVRTSAALVALIIGGGIILLMHAMRGMPGPSIGGILFEVLTWLSLIAAWSAGLFFTADCLSEEKREGTLGLLFLTDLRGYDVATGKLMAASMRCFYGLLAVFPVLAITFLLGGVTGDQFYKTMLALVNALFCSLAAGLFVSALSRDSQKALASTLLLLILLAAGGYVADSLLNHKRPGIPQPFFALSSPWYAFLSAGSGGMTPFWTGLGLSNSIGWLLLAATCVLVPRTWQDRSSRARTARDSRSYFWRYGGRRRRARLRRTLLEQNPVMWLCCRERWQGLVVWALALLMVGQFAFLPTRYGQDVLQTWRGIGWLVVVMLYLWAASQACRFFIEARTTGLIELLLAAPVEAETIVRGHWQALLRMFAVPVLIILVSHGAGSYFAQQLMRSRFASAARPPAGTSAPSSGNTNRQRSPVSSSTTVQAGSGQSNSGASVTTNSSGGVTYSYTTVASSPPVVIDIASSAVGMATTAANLLAVTWFALWMGMTSKSNSIATLKTIGFVQVAPFLVIWFASMLVTITVLLPQMIGGNAGSKAPKWMASIGEWIPVIMLGVTFLLSVAKDIGFALWARAKLRSSFRQVASEGVGKPVIAVPPQIPTATALPPKIAGA